MQDHGFSARRNHGMVAVHEVVTMHEVENIAWQTVERLECFSMMIGHALHIDQVAIDQQ